MTGLLHLMLGTDPGFLEVGPGTPASSERWEPDAGQIPEGAVAKEP